MTTLLPIPTHDKYGTAYPPWYAVRRNTEPLPDGWPIAPSPSTDAIGRGGRCCERALRAWDCVCSTSYVCPEHGRTCVGTHD